MAKYAPHINLFKDINKLSAIERIIFWVILGLSISSVVLNKFIVPQKVTDILNVLNIIGIGLFFTIGILVEYIFLPQADSKRRDDFIDNSFGSKFSPKNSVEYYDNDEINLGLYKASVNLFENCFFTYSLSKIVTVSKIIIPTIILIVMLIISYYGFKEVPFALSTLQTLFSANILGVLIKHIILINKLSTIQDSWIQLFQNKDYKINTFKYQASIYRYWLQYETLHSKISAGIPDSVFQKNNESLTLEWERIKSQYNIS
ncbi:hypothetical protein [Tenacibaculum finnmarkense]|uniref:hypothetical protein n=1 Tax=Tenacibaculum finnmarkense TaxID=2781243 RepID=UPI001E3F4580|nr:hypothetical protein [Tenacibaculum finnmarkense]MCD8411253.1 hypothetical protein [Tenacibaculum finnmarkense genomovar ulcerans]